MADISAAGDSHVGQVRGGNEDALLVGTNVFAVADGMGGHVAGEVASETALGPVARLDGRGFGNADAALDALRAAVQEANEHVLGRAEGDPDLRGMGTTLTVAMVEDRRLHLAHVGDSRAYLLRDGRLSQLTQDHTLVQDLIDDGQLTPEEAAAHPKRSIVTRAIGVAEDLPVDATSLPLRTGDRILLCSDGLTNVVDDDEIADQLGRADHLDAAVDQLIEWANARGGPDNITAVALGFEEDRIGESAARTTGELTPIAPAEDPPGQLAADEAPGGDREPVRVSTRTEQQSRKDWAGRLGKIGALATPAGSRREPRRRSTAVRVGIVVVGLVILGLAAAGFGWWQLSQSYYVGIAGDEIVVYNGIPNDVGPLDLSWVHEQTGVTADDVPAHLVDDLRDGVLAADPAEARSIVRNAEQRGAAEAAEQSGQPDGAGPSPGSSATAPGRPTGSS